MAEKLETQEAPPDHVPEVESTGFSPGNITRTLVTMDAPSDYVPPERRSGDSRDDEIAAFDMVKQHVNAAEYRVGVLSAGLLQHILTLKARIRIREPETQAQISIDEVDSLLADLLLAREALFAVIEGNDEQSEATI